MCNETVRKILWLKFNNKFTKKGLINAIPVLIVHI